jgi:hypothetical protein
MEPLRETAREYDDRPAEHEGDFEFEGDATGGEGGDEEDWVNQCITPTFSPFYSATVRPFICRGTLPCADL